LPCTRAEGQPRVSPDVVRYQSQIVPCMKNERWAARSGPSPFQVWELLTADDLLDVAVVDFDAQRPA